MHKGPKNSLNQSKTCIIEGVGPILLEKSKKARRINISVKPFKGVRVAVPLRVSYRRAEKFAHSQSDWIKRHLIKMRHDEELYKRVAKNLSDIDKDTAQRLLVKKVTDLAREHDFTFNKVTIRNQKTRWGSCSVKNNISLNVKLVRLPEKLSDYVILHELLHTRIKNHGKKFWRELDNIVDNAKALRTQLREYGFILGP
jgi:predicted metal-dependent hydrolase